jgi:hypothetical protein
MHDADGSTHTSTHTRTHTRTQAVALTYGVGGCTLCVRMGEPSFICVWGRAHTPTRTPPAVRQTHARTRRRSHAHAGAVHLTSYRCAHACVHRRTHNQTRSLAAGCALISTPAHARKHTRHTCARACSRTNTQARTHTSTFALTRADGARCRVCASALRRRYTPLHWAAGYGHTAVAAALLAHGADVNAKDDHGCGGRSPIRGDGRRAPWPTGTGPLQCGSGRTDGHTRDSRMHTHAHRL